MTRRIPVSLSSPCPTCSATDPWVIQNAATGCVTCRVCRQWGEADVTDTLALQAASSAYLRWWLDVAVAGVAIEIERRDEAAAAA